MAAKKLTPTQVQLADYMDSFHHRTYVSTDGYDKRTVVNMHKAGLIEKDSVGCYRLTSTGRKLYRSQKVLGG